MYPGHCVALVMNDTPTKKNKRKKQKKKTKKKPNNDKRELTLLTLLTLLFNVLLYNTACTLQ